MGRDDAGRAEVTRAVTSTGDAVDAATLRALHAGDAVSSAVLADWAARVRRDAVHVEELHLQALRDAGLSEASVVGVTAAVAVGEADRRLASVEALRAARREPRR